MILYLLIISTLFEVSLARRKDPDPCPSIKYSDYNPNRIPSTVTGIYCLNNRNTIGRRCSRHSKVYTMHTI